jgi:glutathione S-transferase
MEEKNDSMSQSVITKNVEVDCLANMPEFSEKVKAQVQAANAG